MTYVANSSKQGKTTKLIKVQWIASIGCLNDQNNAKLQKCSNYNELHRFDVKTIKTTLNFKRDQITMNLHRFDVKTIKSVELRRKTFKTTLNYKSAQNTMTCIDLMTKRSKQRNTTRTIDDELNRLDVKTIKTTQNSKNVQNTMTCIDLMTKRSKQRKTTKAIELLWIASIWRQNDQNNAKLQKQSNYDQFAFNRRLNDQNVELRRKTFKTMLNYKSAQNTMTCIDLMTKRSKQRNTTRTIDDEFHRFDDKTI